MAKIKRGITRKEREERWAKCIKFIERTNTLDAARALASKEGFGADTSVWISAWGKLLEKRQAGVCELPAKARAAADGEIKLEKHGTTIKAGQHRFYCSREQWTMLVGAFNTKDEATVRTACAEAGGFPFAIMANALFKDTPKRTT